MAYPIILAIVACVVIIACKVAGDRKRSEAPRPPSKPTEPADNKAKDQGKEKDKKKGPGWWSLIRWLIVVVLLVWGFTTHWGATTKETVTACLGKQVVQPQEEWVLDQSLPPGQYDHGLNSRTFEAKIVKNDSESLWFETTYRCGGDEKLTSWYLTKADDTFSGSWSQNSPKDGGSIYLKKSGDRWTGQYRDEADKCFTITLRKK